MSKVLVDEEVLNFVAVALKRGELVAPNSIDQKRCTDSLRMIENEIQESKQKNFSILKWHPMNEKPEMERCGESEQVLVKDLEGIIRAVGVDFCEFQDDRGEYLSGFYPDGEHWSEFVEWAYLTE